MLEIYIAGSTGDSPGRSHPLGLLCLHRKADRGHQEERDLAPDRSWRVIMRPHSRELRWQDERDGKMLTVDRDPGTSVWQRAWTRVARHVPYIERLL